MSLSLWECPGEWINNPLGYVFLPRAMLEIGKALFPDEWTGNEPYLATCLTFDQAVVALIRQRPGALLDWAAVVQARQKFAEDCERQRKEDLAKAKRAGALELRRFPPALRATNPYGQTDSRPIVKPHMAWRVKSAFHVERLAAERYAGVCTKVADALRSGQLLCGTRPRQGGSVTPGKCEWWGDRGRKACNPISKFCYVRN